MTDTNPWRSTGAGRTDWRDHAACSGLDPDLFFPVSASGASLTEIEAARRICQCCPVMTPCLRWALDLGQVSGIWGGTTEEERRALRRGPAPRSPAEPVPAGCAQDSSERTAEGKRKERNSHGRDEWQRRPRVAFVRIPHPWGSPLSRAHAGLPGDVVRGGRAGGVTMVVAFPRGCRCVPFETKQTSRLRKEPPVQIASLSHPVS